MVYILSFKDIIKDLEHSSNNRQVFLCLWKGHIKRSLVQHLQETMTEKGIQIDGMRASDKDSKYEIEYQYPVLEAASAPLEMFQRSKVI